MCGIAGLLLATADRTDGELREIAGSMSCAVRHRGPDDHGAWSDPYAGIALGHRRLSIIDLSPHGHQPMHSATERYTIVYNGELYNYRALRDELGSPASGTWHGHSDTEVMLAAFERWGIVPALRRFNGMFAVALWDRHDRVLHLIRDPVGEKPLYYASVGGGLAFGSDLASLRCAPGWRGAIDTGSLAAYLDYGYVRSPRSIYTDARRVPPGHVLSVRPAGVAAGVLPEPVAFWSLDEQVTAAQSEQFGGTPDEAVAELDLLVRDSVRLRMESDVPYGAFLSGGIDSSLVVALMQAQSSEAVQTFTIGFDAEHYDEAERAAAIAAELGTRHTQLRLTPNDALMLVPELPKVFSEPFADSSQLPTLLVSRLARTKVTVALSGDGGDELFGGYSRYQLAERIWRRASLAPAFFRRAMASAVEAVPDAVLDAVGAPLRPAARIYGRPGRMSDKLRKGAALLAATSDRTLYHQLTTTGLSAALLQEPISPPDADNQMWTSLPAYLRRMQYVDTAGYLPDDILVKLDRAAMWVSLETRVPLLDTRVLEFAWRLPERILRADGAGKWPLRQLLGKYVPRSLITGPKRGFAVPLAAWLRGPLRDWTFELLSPARIRSDGIFNESYVTRLVAEHMSGRRNWQNQLWILLMFQSWMDGHTAS